MVKGRVTAVTMTEAGESPSRYGVPIMGGHSDGRGGDEKPGAEVAVMSVVKLPLV